VITEHKFRFNRASNSQTIDFNNWYNEERLAELLSVPGLLHAARYEAVKSGHKHMDCYELESPGVVGTRASKDRPRTD